MRQVNYKKKDKRILEGELDGQSEKKLVEFSESVENFILNRMGNQK